MHSKISTKKIGKSFLIIFIKNKKYICNLFFIIFVILFFFNKTKKKSLIQFDLILV